MENKEKYYTLLRANNGQLNEIDLGAKIGLNENETQAIISQLLSEYRIAYLENKACNYSVFKKRKNGR